MSSDWIANSTLLLCALVDFRIKIQTIGQNLSPTNDLIISLGVYKYDCRDFGLQMNIAYQCHFRYKSKRLMYCDFGLIIR